MRLLYFAWVRERIGKSEETLDLPEGINSIADLMGWLSEFDEGYRNAFSDPSKIRAALDQVFVPLERNIEGGKEVAFFPPVTGG